MHLIGTISVREILSYYLGLIFARLLRLDDPLSYPSGHGPDFFDGPV